MKAITKVMKMSKTNDLRQLIYTQLNTISGIKAVYSDVADNEAIYPHIVFTINSIDLGDSTKCDYIVDIDVWDKGTSTTIVIDLADAVECLFQDKLEPQETILPVFYLVSNKKILDEDKTIQHRLVQVQVKLNERS